MVWESRRDSPVTRHDHNAHSDLPIDAMAPDAALSAMLGSQVRALDSVAPALPKIAEAAALMAQVLGQGGVVHYAAAGSSGLMALADACELPGTFGIAQAQVRIHMAGGVPSGGVMPGDTEDDAAEAQCAARHLRAGDLAIVLSASGTTPYALAFAEAARTAGARIVAIANVAGAPLLAQADVAIALETGPEILAGSTRLGAGTAQKVALNMISTQAGILLGHVHDGLMVNLKPDNIKLRRRAVQIVARVARVADPAAQAALEATGFDTKPAVLVAAGADLGAARALLAEHKGRLGACLAALAEKPII